MTVLEQRYMETVCHCLPKITEALESIAEAIYDELSDEQKEALRKDTNF